MPEDEKIIQEIDAFVQLWEEEVKAAEMVRNEAQVKLLNACHYFMETGAPEDGRAFDLCIMFFDKALEVLQRNRDTLRKAGYYAECIRGSVRELAGIRNDTAPEENKPEQLKKTISLSAEKEDAFLKFLDTCKESYINGNHKVTEIIIKF